VIRGQRRLPACQEGAVYHAAGIRQGPFELALPVPAPVDPDAVEARYERGLLRVTLPKRRTG
jgi:HSP20 family protein